MAPHWSGVPVVMTSVEQTMVQAGGGPIVPPGKSTSATTRPKQSPPST